MRPIPIAGVCSAVTATILASLQRSKNCCNRLVCLAEPERRGVDPRYAEHDTYSATANTPVASGALRAARGGRPGDDS